MASVCDHRSSAHVWSSDMESDCPIVLREQMFEMPFHSAGLFTQMWPSGCVWNCMWEAEMKKLDSYTLRLYLHSRFHWCLSIFWMKQWKTIETMTSWYAGWHSLKGLISVFCLLTTKFLLCLAVFLRKESWKIKRINRISGSDHTERW